MIGFSKLVLLMASYRILVQSAVLSMSYFSAGIKEHQFSSMIYTRFILSALWSSIFCPFCLAFLWEFLGLFVVSWNYGLGAITWLWLSEIYPMEIRGLQINPSPPKASLEILRCSESPNLQTGDCEKRIT